jgi:hypothetical protein
MMEKHIKFGKYWELQLHRKLPKPLLAVLSLGQTLKAWPAILGAE